MSIKLKFAGGIKIVTAMMLFTLVGLQVRAQNKQEIMLTIEPLVAGEKIVHFTKGEDLRKLMKFREAMAEYKEVIVPGELCGKEAEAHYDIGICYLWLMKLDTAKTVFHEVMASYANPEVIAFSQFSLAWIDVQQRNFQAAIDRLQQTLDNNIYSNENFSARTQFEIGRIYLIFLHDVVQAKQAFYHLREKYPNSETVQHPFVPQLLGE